MESTEFFLNVGWPVLPWLSLTPVTPHFFKSKPVLGPKRPVTYMVCKKFLSPHKEANKKKIIKMVQIHGK